MVDRAALVVEAALADDVGTLPFICITSPSTRLAKTLATSSTTSLLPRRESASDARASKKSPARIESLLPKRDGAEGADRRVAARSITSSCSSEATWINSVISASLRCVGKRLEAAEGSEGEGEEEEEEKAAIGFRRRSFARSSMLGFSSMRTSSCSSGSSTPIPFPSLLACSRSASLCWTSFHLGLSPLVAWLIKRTIIGRTCLPSARK